MYIPIQTQPDCSSAWLAAADKVNNISGHEAHNVIIDIEDPIANTALDNFIMSKVNAFLEARGKSVECIANTIFPYALYKRHGAPKFMDVFHTKILPKIRKKELWSGYYFERMTCVPTHSGAQINQLWSIVERMRNNRSLNKFEVSLFDAERDTNDSPYGGQCLSFLSFKLLPGSPKTLTLTAMYRNHYYIEKLLGNLVGLGRLMAFVAQETGSKIGSLTVISTHAKIDTPDSKQSEVTKLIQECLQAATNRSEAA